MKADTLKIAKRLERAGVEREQATAHAEVYGEMQEELATKADIASLQTNLDATKTYLEGKIAKVEASVDSARGEFKQEIAGVREEVAGVRGEIKQEIAGVREEIAGVREEMAANKAYLEGKIDRQLSSFIKWMVGTQFATIGIIVAVMGFLHL